MKRYEIRVTIAAAKQFRKLPPGIRARIKPVLAALADEPRPQGVVKLSGEENAWRVRVGDYRIIYEIHDNVLLVLVFDIDRRRSVHRKG